jgi:maltose/maltodextrin transport system permease protein
MLKEKMLPALLYALIVGVALALIVQVFLSGRDTLGFTLLVLLALFGFVYAWRGAYVYRYLFPSLFAFSVFVVLPLAYTVYISFTNYSGANLQTFHDVQDLIAREKDTDVSSPFAFKIYRPTDPAQPTYRILLTGKSTDGSNVVETLFQAEGALPADLAGPDVQWPAVPAGERPADAAMTMADIIKIREHAQENRRDPAGRNGLENDQLLGLRPATSGLATGFGRRNVPPHQNRSGFEAGFRNRIL